jgi:hypothetical protein
MKNPRAALTITLFGWLVSSAACVVPGSGPGGHHAGAGYDPTGYPDTEAHPGAHRATGVVVNDVGLEPATLHWLATHHRLQIPPGHYWYDPTSGAFGYQGGPTVGFLYPGLELGGALRADASGGDTGVFINGRELHSIDLAALQQLVGQPIARGHYWLDAQGNAGVVGAPAQVNLVQLARQRGATGQNGHIYRGVGGNMGSDGDCFYYNDPSSGSSVMGGNC